MNHLQNDDNGGVIDADILHAQNRMYRGSKSEAFTGDSYGFSRAEACRILGDTLYAYQYPDGTIKIGYTSQLEVRSLRYTNAQLVAIHPGTCTDEAAVHQSLTAHRAHGREYYHTVPEVLTLINEWRKQCRMEPI